MGAGYGTAMDSHGLPITADDTRILAAAGIRIEVVRPDGDALHGGLIALPSATGSHAVVTLARTPAGPWTFSDRDADGDAVGLPFPDMARPGAFPGMRDATSGDLQRLGLLGTGGRLEGDAIDALAGRDVRDAGDPFETDTTHERGRTLCEVRTSDLYGYQVADLREMLFSEACPLGPVDPGVEAAMARALAAWTDAMRAMSSPHGPSPLSAATWTDEAARHLADPDRGRYRMQAVSLYPAFAPAFVGDRADAELLAAVDAGIPFEDELARALSGWGDGVEGKDVLDRARLRRLRAIPAGIWGPDAVGLLGMAIDLPLHQLPATAEGWERMASHVRAIDGFARRFGLPVARLVRQSLEADERTASAWDGYPEILLERLRDAADMVDAIRDAFLDRLLRGHAWSTKHNSRVAGRLLFAGLHPARILDVSARWHAEGVAVTRRGCGPATWPALFPDFARPGGLVVSCLTSTQALVDEGGADMDPHGIHGLHHCVSTYSGPCSLGRVHVASVRRPGPEGTHVRVSTVAIEAERDGDRMRTAVVQHRGHANAPPPADAVAAVSALLAELNRRPMPGEVSDLAGRIAVSHGGHDADMPRLVAAWNPYLPPGHRASSPDEAQRIVLSILDGAVSDIA
jgi:hypothetical protein